MLDVTAEDVLQGFITDDYEKQHLARIALVNVHCVGRIFFSVKTAGMKGMVSIFDDNKPRLEAGDITVPPRGENNDLGSLKLDFSAD